MIAHAECFVCGVECIWILIFKRIKFQFVKLPWKCDIIFVRSIYCVFCQMPPVGRRKISEFLSCVYHAIPADLARSISIPADPFLRISDRVRKLWPGSNKVTLPKMISPNITNQLNLVSAEGKNITRTLSDAAWVHPGNPSTNIFLRQASGDCFTDSECTGTTSIQILKCKNRIDLAGSVRRNYTRYK